VTHVAIRDLQPWFPTGLEHTDVGGLKNWTTTFSMCLDVIVYRLSGCCSTS
jgi:hypothetical protein